MSLVMSSACKEGHLMWPSSCIGLFEITRDMARLFEVPRYARALYAAKSFCAIALVAMYFSVHSVAAASLWASEARPR